MTHCDDTNTKMMEIDPQKLFLWKTVGVICLVGNG